MYLFYVVVVGGGGGENADPLVTMQLVRNLTFSTTVLKITSLQSRLDVMKSGKDSVTPEESSKIHKNHQQVIRLWRKRKRMVNSCLHLSRVLFLPSWYTVTLV